MGGRSDEVKEQGMKKQMNPERMFIVKSGNYGMKKQMNPERMYIVESSNYGDIAAGDEPGNDYAALAEPGWSWTGRSGRASPQRSGMRMPFNSERSQRGNDNEKGEDYE